MKCDNCDGKGYITKLDIMQAKSTKVQCDKCKGSGYIKSIQTDGPRVGELKCVTYFYQWLKDSKVIATMEVRIRPILDDNGKMMTKGRDPVSGHPVPRIFVEIVRMNTKPKYRKQGYMTQLLQLAMQDPKVEWIETSWDDSTADGRNFLLSRGFEQNVGQSLRRRLTDEESRKIV